MHSDSELHRQQWRAALRALASAAIDALDALEPDPDHEPDQDVDEAELRPARRAHRP